MKYFEKLRINKIVKRINDIKLECPKRQVPDIRVNLEKIAILAQSPFNTLTYKKSRLINESLNQIVKVLDNHHINYIKCECDKINDIILDKYVPTSKDEEEARKCKINTEELQDELTNISVRLKEVNQEMDACLGKDEITWRKLNAERKSLLMRQQLFNKQFNESLLRSQNLAAVKDAKDLRNKYANPELKHEIINIDEFNENIDVINFNADETVKQSDAISSKICESTLDNEDEYRKALEEKLLKENANNEEMENTIIFNESSKQENIVNKF